MLLSPRSAFEVKQQNSSASKAKRKSNDMAHARKKVAIIGSGCSGLGAAWALRDSQYDVHIFEESSRLGGHTNTQTWRHDEKSTPVDTGFIVMNTATYPNFIRFLDHIGVEPRETEMTFGVSRDGGLFEWSGEPQGIFAQRRNIFRPGHWRMLFDIARFNQFALDLLASDDEGEIDRPGSSPKYRKEVQELTIGEYLDREGYSQAFRDDYLIPMTAAVWSTSPDKASLEFPAQTLVRFMWNHHLLSTFAARPAWLTIPGGSQRYIDAIVKSFEPERLHLHLSSAVRNVLRPARSSDGGVHVSWLEGQKRSIKTEVFDHVIFACHGDQILPLLSKQSEASRKALADRTNLGSAPRGKKSTDQKTRRASDNLYVSDEEQEIFSAFETTSNKCYLHSDLSLMPQRRKCWTSWNYLISSRPSKLSHPAGVSLTYCMNILQHLSEETYGPVLVTMNPDHPPDRRLTQGEFNYRHPLYTRESVRAQKQLKRIQNHRGVSYCGAWTKYGFHEDGFSSGLQVAVDHLGAKLPFEFTDSTYSRGRKPLLGWRDYVFRLFLLLILMCIQIGERVLALPGIAWMVAVASGVLCISLDLAEHVGLLDIM